MDNGQWTIKESLRDDYKKTKYVWKQLESFQNRLALIINCQLSIVNSEKPPNSNLSSVFPLSYPIPVSASRKKEPETHCPAISCHRTVVFAAPCPRIAGLLFPEGLAVGALIHGGVRLVSAHQDLLQRAVVFVVAVVGALGNGALDTLIRVTAHT